MDLPPLVPSLFARHILPALSGAVTLVFVCLIPREFGGKAFAVGLSTLGFIIVPPWLNIDSIFFITASTN